MGECHQADDLRDQMAINIFLSITPTNGGGAKAVEEEGPQVTFPPPTYLDNFSIILKTYEFGLRFKERTAGRLQ